MTNHDPHNVDRYLRDFERVYDMAREVAPLSRACFLTSLSPRLVKEYLKILGEQKLTPTHGHSPATSSIRGGEAHGPA